MAATRYTDVNTRAVYSPTQGTIGQAGKIAKFWLNSAGTQPVDIGLYSAASPDTPGASTGSNQLTVQADGMWPAMWDRTGTQDHVYLQVGTLTDPGQLYVIYCDTDQRLDRLEAMFADVLLRIAVLEFEAPGGSAFMVDGYNPTIMLADLTVAGISSAGGVLSVDLAQVDDAVAYGPVLVVTT